jgi:hypothetical protein
MASASCLLYMSYLLPNSRETAPRPRGSSMSLLLASKTGLILESASELAQRMVGSIDPIATRSTAESSPYISRRAPPLVDFGRSWPSRSGVRIGVQKSQGT